MFSFVFLCFHCFPLFSFVSRLYSVYPTYLVFPVFFLVYSIDSRSHGFLPHFLPQILPQIIVFIKPTTLPHMATNRQDFNFFSMIFYNLLFGFRSLAPVLVFYYMVYGIKETDEKIWGPNLAQNRPLCTTYT